MMVLLGKLLRDHICDPQIEKPDRIPKCEAHALSVLINSIWRVLTWIR